MQVITPIDTLYDVDGDKLVDFQLWWNDSGSAVDYQQVKVRSLTGVNGPANGSDNLLSAWRVDRVDAAGIVFHETLDNLLHGGPNRVEITIPDKAGNVSFDTLDFSVPQGAFLKTISTGLGGSLPAEGLAICPDDQRLYMTANRNLVVFARDSLKVLPDLGRADAVTLSKDGQKLFATIIEGVTRGLAEIDTQRDSVTRVLYLFNYYCINVALSSSESRAFVTTQDNGSPSENVLVDLNNWRVLQTFPRPRAPGAARFDNDVVFDFSGKLVFVTHDLDLDVYLSRE